MSRQDLRIQELEKELRYREKEVDKLRIKNNDLSNSVSVLESEVFKYQDLVHSSNSLIAIFLGEDHIINIANQAIRNTWGKGNDVIGKPLLEILPELRDQGIKELLDQVYQTGIAYHADEVPIELIIDGKPEIRYFDFTYQPQKNIDGKIIGVADIATDVTKQAVLNKKIKESEREFRDLVNFMPHKISIAEPDSTVTFYNKSWLDYAGKDLEEFLEQPWLDIVHPEEKEKVLKKVECHFSKGEPLEMEIRLRDLHGDYYWHLCRTTPLRSADGVIYSWLTSSTEIQKLKDEEKRKEDFLKLVSHELKTPVTSIKGYIQLLLSVLPNNNGEAEKKLTIKPYLNRIETQVERLIRLLSEMLDMSRIEQNELELKYEEFNLNRQVEEIGEYISYTNRDLQIELNHEDDCNVNADRGRIGQVIINFVTNAVKYSPNSNRVKIKIHKNSPEEVAVTVKDFGIGIDEKEQNQIFRRFYRVSGNKDDTYAGFGIGLYLSNEIIERHQGRILVKSEPGKGSEFTFTIPLNQN